MLPRSRRFPYLPILVLFAAALTLLHAEASPAVASSSARTLVLGGLGNRTFPISLQ